MKYNRLPKMEKETNYMKFACCLLKASHTFTVMLFGQFSFESYGPQLIFGLLTVEVQRFITAFS